MELYRFPNLTLNLTLTPTLTLTLTLTLANGVGTNFGVGVGEARPEGQRPGDEVLGEGTASPSHQLGGLWERCKLPQRGPGRVVF